MPNGDKKATAQFVENGVRREVQLDAGVVGAIVFDLKDLRRAQKAQEIATEAPVISEIFDWDAFDPADVGSHGVLSVSSPEVVAGAEDQAVWWHVSATCKWFHSTEPPPQ